MSIDKKFIGKIFSPYTYYVSREKIKEYAKAVKNLSPYYIDEEFAKKSKYGVLIAPPTFSNVLCTYLIEPVFQDKELLLDMAMIVHGEQEMEYFEVIKAGDSITVSAMISNIENKKNLDIMSVQVTLKNQHGRIVCREIYTFVIRK